MFYAHFLPPLSVCHLFCFCLFPARRELVRGHVPYGRVNPVPVVGHKGPEQGDLGLSCIPKLGFSCKLG